MNCKQVFWCLGLMAASIGGCTTAEQGALQTQKGSDLSVSLGQRPLFLIDGMDAGALRQTLRECASGPLRASGFSMPGLIRKPASG